MHAVYLESESVEESRHAGLPEDFDFQLNDFESLKRLEICPTKCELEKVKRIQEERNNLNRTTLELIISGFKEELVGFEMGFNCIRLTPDYLAEIQKNRLKFVGFAPWKVQLELKDLIQHLDVSSKRIV